MALSGALAPLLASAGVLAYRAFQYRNAATRESTTLAVVPEDRAFLLETAGSSILKLGQEQRNRAPGSPMEDKARQPVCDVSIMAERSEGLYPDVSAGKANPIHGNASACRSRHKKAARYRTPLAAIEADWNAVRLLLAALVPESSPIGPRPASRVAVGGNVYGHARQPVVAIAIGRRQLACAVRRNLVDRPEGFHPEGDAFLVVPEKLLELRQCP
jgi:hypothetical protein